MHIGKAKRFNNIGKAMAIMLLCGVLLATTTQQANATVDESNPISDIFDGIGDAILFLTIATVITAAPLVGNTYSIVTKKPVHGLFHVTGFTFGAISTLLGASAVGEHPEVGAMFLTVGVCHIFLAYQAHKIKPPKTTGMLLPMLTVDEQGKQHMGLSWVQQF